MDTIKAICMAVWPWLRMGLWMFGLLCVGGVAWVNHCYALHHPSYRGTPIQVSEVASRIASRFSPTLQGLATEHKDEAMAQAGGVIQRWALGKLWDPAVAAIPRGTEIATNAGLDALCNMPIRELTTDLNEHAMARGKPIHWSIRAAAEANR